MYDIIPDIHGQALKLEGALNDLGYRFRKGAWRHSDPQRKVVFLGDFIDRGPDNRNVLTIVRSMIDAGTALAVMGNHELNAIHFHALGEDGPLRAHSQKNTDQHAAFLKEFPLGASHTEEALGWMASLPLYLEFGGFRAAHACWDEAVVDALREVTNAGALTADQLRRAASKDDPLSYLAETTTKGPELVLPAGFHFEDKGGYKRDSVRQKWWTNGAATWREVAMSVPDPNQLPDTTLPTDLQGSFYPTNAPPVFFGHYWLEGDPVLQARNVLCLDYSAGKDGPLVSYGAEEGQCDLSLERLRVH